MTRDLPAETRRVLRAAGRVGAASRRTVNTAAAREARLLKALGADTDPVTGRVVEGPGTDAARARLQEPAERARAQALANTRLQLAAAQAAKRKKEAAGS